LSGQLEPADYADVVAVPQLPIFRVRMLAGSNRRAAIAVVAVNAQVSLRFMAPPLQAILYQLRRSIKVQAQCDPVLSDGHRSEFSNFLTNTISS